MVRGDGGTVARHGQGRAGSGLAVGDGRARAEAAGAEVVGADDLADQIDEAACSTPTSAMLRTPDTMASSGEARPCARSKKRGLRPNPKTDTVTNDIGRKVGGSSRAVRSSTRNDRHGHVHVPIGKVSFPGLRTPGRNHSAGCTMTSSEG